MGASLSVLEELIHIIKKIKSYNTGNMSLNALLQNWKIFLLSASSVSCQTSLTLQNVFSLVNCSVMKFVYNIYSVVLIKVQ